MTQLSLNRSVTKRTVEHLCLLLLSNKKKQMILAHDNLDSSKGLNEKKIISKGYILYDSICITFLKFKKKL